MTAVIWCFVALCAIMAGVYIRQQYVGTPWSALLSKTLASALFVTVGVLCTLVPVARVPFYAPLMLLGLSLGMAGDVALACQSVCPSRRSLWFLVGMGLFAAGHVAYVLLFLRLAPLGWPQPVVAGCFLALGLVLMRRLRVQAGRMTFPVVGYLAILSLMVGCAAGAFLSAPSLRNTLLLVGALSFFLSDSLLAYIKFGPRNIPALSAWNLISYYLAQLLLALSIGIS